MKYSPFGAADFWMVASYRRELEGNEVVKDMTLLICVLVPVQRTIAYLVTFDKEVADSESVVSSTHFTDTMTAPLVAS